MHPSSYQLKSVSGFEFDELVFIDHTDTNSKTAERKNDLNRVILETFLEIQAAFHKANHRPFQKCKLFIKHSGENANVFFIKRRKPDAEAVVLEITRNRNTYASTTGKHKVHFSSLKTLLTYMLAKSS